MRTDIEKLTDTELNGFRVIICRIRGEHLCGYVILPPIHKMYQVDYSTINEFVEVHGGWTYDDDHLHTVIAPGDVWVIGFDCAHAGDARTPELTNEHQTYRDEDYVLAQLDSATKQLSQYWKPKAFKLHWTACPCGQPACNKNYPTNLGVFFNGSGFTAEEAKLLDEAFAALAEKNNRL